jgi:hypothetical protein
MKPPKDSGKSRGREDKYGDKGSKYNDDKYKDDHTEGQRVIGDKPPV